MLNHPALMAAMVDFLVVVSPTVNQNEILKPLSLAVLQTVLSGRPHFYTVCT